MIKKILFGLLLFLGEWFIWANIFGCTIYLIKSLEKLEFIDAPYWVVLGGGTIYYILVEFLAFKVKEIVEFLGRE